MKRLALTLTAAAALATAAAAEELPWAEGHVGRTLSYAEAAVMAKGKLQQLLDRGKDLFTAKFTVLDGAGRPKATQAIVPTKRKRGENAAFQRTGGPDANACSGCHNDPITGAAGDFVANVFVSEGFESADFDSIDPQFSNERNSNSLTGSGLVELLAREMTADLQAQRKSALKAARETKTDVTVDLAAKGVSFGKLTAKPDGVVDVSKLHGVDTDLVVRPFSQKGVFASLRQFTINAMNKHHGIQAAERFGLRWTGTADFDEDKKPDELGEGDVSAVTLFQAELAPPVRRTDLPENWKAAAAAGEKSFGELGCGGCHMPYLPLKSMVFSDPGPHDAAGTLRAKDVAETIALDLAGRPWAKSLKRNGKGEWLVPLFGDLKRHVIVDTQVATLGNEIMGQRFVERDVFMTAELWGIGSTAPYGHRGDLGTLDEAIRAHGGEARAARDAYVKADEATRSNLIAFLKTMVIAK
ncbi:MAG: di-heme oxidoredictase family protein [Hyphomicrobiales bacterium]